MSIRAHMYELDECFDNLGNDEKLIEELYNKIYGSSEFYREFLVVSREDMKKIISMMREIAREDGELWDWARERFSDDIECYGDEDGWRRWVDDFAFDTENTLKESKKGSFLIWYY